LKIYILFFFILTTFGISAQNFKGIVYDRTSNKPIIDANVYIKNSDFGDRTNKKGWFNIKISSRTFTNDTLVISHISYNTVKIVKSDFTINDTVFLSLKTNILDEIQLIEKRKLKRNLNFKKLALLPKQLHSFASLLIDKKIYVFGGDLTLNVDVYRKALNDFDYYQADPSSSMQDFFRNVFFSRQPTFQDFNNELLIYDIQTNQWTSEDIGLRKRAYHNINYDKENNEVYILGGKRLSKNRESEYLDDTIEVLDRISKSIKIDKTNPHQAVNFESFIYKNNLIILGGSIKRKKDKEKVYSNKIHFYDIKSGLWYHIGNMPVGKETNGILVEDKIFLFGGYDKKPLTQIESYNLITGKWKIEGDLFITVSRPAIAKKDHTIYIFEEGRIFTYNLVSKDLKDYHVNIFLKASKMYIANNKLFILGGFYDGEFSILPSNELFSIDLEEFENTRVYNIKRL